LGLITNCPSFYAVPNKAASPCFLSLSGKAAIGWEGALIASPLDNPGKGVYIDINPEIE
jgi:hypothetical protein